MKRFPIFLTATVIFLISGLKGQEFTHAFQNPNNKIEDRVDDLISKLTLEEKVGQLMFQAPSIDRLGIAEYSWWNECLHGVARNGRATVFPQAIGMGATFDADLMERIGVAISDEARAKFNENRRRGYTARYSGLTFWSPNVNLFRDPRWGRGQETYGEDPHHISKMGVSFVNGLQGEGPWLKTAAMAKHYAVHSGPEKLRHEFDAVVSGYDLWNTYLPAFKALVTEAKVEGVMGAYNRTNGQACCAHDYLMDEVLRGRWDFQGYFVSDCWALVDFHSGHNIVETPSQAAALALNAGCNLNCGSTYPNLIQSIEEGLTTESEIDKNLRELLPTRFRLGLFDPIGSVPYDHISTEVVRSQEHLDLSYEAAAKSIVLLKNQDDILPLDPNIESVFVTGPMATNVQALLANYYGVSDDLKTILEGIVGNVGDHTAIRFVQGSLMDRPNVNPIDWYSDEAKEAKVTIACMGISQLIEGEEGEAIASPSAGDRDYISLPPHQIEFLKLLRSKAEKLVVVITGGSAISIPEVHEMADAVLYAWYPGERGGQAVGDIIFGKVNPSGKLPVTFVNDISDLPAYENYDMSDRTYRYMASEPLYPFGYGLSYTDFEYGQITFGAPMASENGRLSIEIPISNVGNSSGEEVVQLYISKVDKGTQDANFTLKRFQRIHLLPKQSKTMRFVLKDEDLGSYNKEGELKLEKGKYKIILSSAAPFNRSLELGAPQWQELTIDITEINGE